MKLRAKLKQSEVTKEGFCSFGCPYICFESDIIGAYCSLFNCYLNINRKQGRVEIVRDDLCCHIYGE